MNKETTNFEAEISEILEFSKGLCLKVGERISSIIEDQDKEANVSFKSRRDLVTDIDVWSEEVIKKEVGKKYPSHGIIGEETVGSKGLEGDQLKTFLSEEMKSGWKWIVDPIDGTSNFINKIPYVAVSIGVLYNGKPVAGCVYDVSRKELFSAKLGGGAYINQTKIEVGQKTEIPDCIISTGFPYDRKNEWEKYRVYYEYFMQNARGVRRFGAAALDICWVAASRFDIFFEFGLKPWDLAAATLIAKEAGASFGSFGESEEKEVDLLADSFVYTNKTLMPKVLSAVKDKN